MALRIGTVGLGLEASGSNLDPTWLWLFGAGLDLGGTVYFIYLFIYFFKSSFTVGIQK